MKYENVMLWCSKQGKETRHVLTIADLGGMKACVCEECPNGEGNENWPSDEALRTEGYSFLVGR